ncbi:SDR family oxidoreductase [Alkalihalophilus marmarensis]|uniref:Short-chain dehydrogenase n=1 Tax=Alkalihalophilus marmarensis DSM 21297 TaxID=1188261 RepID=U6SVN4_9BACI|nr:SDR family oxidoreductase [Alkalihalophilus marmarensis]ERN54741.1 short-chain dehydrogenase [Alkalihalophilus marmarensis DSM 21297]MCM3488638.1 SDR family oxidoreductase [Alkalihalophilus marmarensis]
MQRFLNHIVLISGAGSGIGKASAIQLASEGAVVILVGRRREKLEETAVEMNNQLREGCAYVYTCDVTVEEEVELLADYVESNFERLDVLINNAGTSQGGAILSLEEEDWNHVQTTNVTSVFLMSKHLGKLMIKSESENKAIVNIASLSGHKAGAKIPSYSTAKAAVIHLTKSLAGELAPHNVRVNSVSPGFVETPMTENGLKNPAFNQAIERHTLLGRVGRPEEVAKTIAFAASSDASYITGTDLLIDGGWLTV